MTSSRRRESDEYPPNHRVFNDVKRLSVWWLQTWLDYFPFHIWDVILPESFPLTNSYFSRWLSHHHPDVGSILFLSPKLVGGLEHFFHSVGNVIIPTDFHSIIFQRGRLKPPTRCTIWLFNIAMENHHFQ